MIKLATPPIFSHLANRLRGNVSAGGLSGDYRSWAEAMTDSTGYDSAAILEKTKEALLKVKSGNAVYERDSVLFEEIQYTWPLLAGLMWVAARNGGALDVLDYGGSLGSTYFQNRNFLSSLPALQWNVVEQAGHVAIGKALFEDGRLFFYSTIADCMAHSQSDCVLFSSVLQYLEDPYAVLGQVMELPCRAILIDRTPFWAGPADRLCVQIVPPSIYPASYPSWIFSNERFRSTLREDWRVMVTYDNPDKLAGPVDFSYQGMILTRSADVS